MGRKSRLFAHLNLSPELRFAELKEEIGKVSGPIRKYSRFAETIDGDGFDQDWCHPWHSVSTHSPFLTGVILLNCRAILAVDFDSISGLKDTQLRISCANPVPTAVRLTQSISTTDKQSSETLSVEGRSYGVRLMAVREYLSSYAALLPPGSNYKPSDASISFTERSPSFLIAMVSREAPGPPKGLARRARLFAHCRA